MWGIRFEDDQNLPLFNKIYEALRVRLDDFGDENEARRKLGKPPKTPSKNMSQRSQYSYPQHHQNSPLDEVPVKYKSKKKKKPRSKPSKKRIKLNDTQKVLKGDIDQIVENINLTNSMIDAADPHDSQGLDLVVDLVNTLKTSESQLVETITNVDQSDLVDYAIKVNEDRQNTIQRFKQLQRGKKPDSFVPVHQNNSFNNPPEEEVKLDMSDAASDTLSNDR